MGSILKTIAFAAGTGVAFGICKTACSRRSPRLAGGGDVLTFEPLLDRLEAMERRAESPVPFASLTSRLEVQEAEIGRLRSLVDTRAAEIGQRLEVEMATQHRLLEQTVDLKVSECVSSIEHKLLEHSNSIDVLRERAFETDANVRRLITSIELLCERISPPVAVASPTLSIAGPVVVAFDTLLAEERRKQDQGTIPEFRSRVGMEPDAPKRPRFPLARLFGMIALVVLTQMLTH